MVVLKIFYDMIKSATIKKVLLLCMSSFFLATAIITKFFGLIELASSATMDSEMFYTSQTFYLNLKQLGETGRNSYLLLHLIDYLFITQFYLLLCFSIILLLKIEKFKKVIFLAFVPFGAALFDLLENLAIDYSIIIYPNKFSLIGNLSGYFTYAKFIFIYFAFTVILLLLIINLYIYIRKHLIKK